LNLDPLYRKLTTNHPRDQRRNKLLRIALKKVEDGLRELITIGYPFHLVEGHVPVIHDFPKIMYHALRAPNGHVIRDDYELKELGEEGWFDTLDAAHHYEGHATQMHGRGGVKRTILPALLETLDFADLERQWREAQEAKAKRIAEFKARLKDEQAQEA
jgi:hypothetical protein